MDRHYRVQLYNSWRLGKKLMFIWAPEVLSQLAIMLQIYSSADSLFNMLDESLNEISAPDFSENSKKD